MDKPSDIEIVTRPRKAPRRLKKASTRRVQSKVKKVPVKKKKKSTAWKFKPTELSECDSAFSKEIIERDQHCLYPGCFVTTNLTNSHYIGRGNWNTRFDPENCIALCLRHHFMDRDTGFEFQKARAEKHGWDGQYTRFMKDRLGGEAWYELLDRADEKKSRKEAIIETQKKYNLRQPLLTGEKAEATP